MDRLKALRSAVAAWWTCWSPRQLRRRVQALEAALGTQHAVGQRLAGKALEHHAWIAALVELQRANPGRYRALRVEVEHRLAALRVAPGPTERTVADDVPAAPAADEVLP